MVRFVTRFCAAAALAAAAFATAATAQPLTAAAALERLFTEPFNADWFAPSFLAQVSPDQIVAIIAELTGACSAR